MFNLTNHYKSFKVAKKVTNMILYKVTLQKEKDDYLISLIYFILKKYKISM